MTKSVPWRLASRVAGRVAGSYALADQFHIDGLREQMPVIVADASALVEAETGLSVPEDPRVILVSREEWAERNLETFSRIIRPAEKRIQARLVDAGPVSRGFSMIARQAVAAETGALVGVLARRVLGQYELVLPTGDGEPDTMAFVGENILALERAHRFQPDEFRMWIALHECAHRAQFSGVDWLRSYFFSLVDTLVAESVDRSGRMKAVVARITDRALGQGPIMDESGLFGLLATPEQRQTLDRVQALMTLLEGHGHYVMDRIGERILPGQARMSAVLKARRSNDARTAAFFRLTGLEMKLRQYERGEAFITSIERKAGFSALDTAWEGSDRLPDLREISDPDQWLKRVA